MSKYPHHTTPRFDKDYNSFTSIERPNVKKLKKDVINNPIPPETEYWKIIHQFDNDYPEGFVGALYINFYDRLVYEFNTTTREITFTNCRGHRWRDKFYSEEVSKSLLELRKLCVTKGQRLSFNRLLNSFKFSDTNN